MLSFTQCFSAKFPCRFCLIGHSKLSSIFHESQCQMRTEQNYLQDLDRINLTETGIAGESVCPDYRNNSILHLMSVDIMHDLLEGAFEYDLGLILYRFIVNAKYFTLEELNDRIRVLDYGQEQNKSQPIKESQIKNKHIKMSASELLSFIRNIGVFIGHKIPLQDKHWNLIILMKNIIDIVTAPVIQKGVADYLEVLISEYLSSLTVLFPGCLKPKHHFLIHYAELMRKLGS